PTSGKHRYHQPRTLNQAATQGGGTSAQRHQCDARHCYDDALAALEVLTADGLVEVRGLCVDVTATGWPLVRLAAMCFDRYLQPSQQAVRYSKAI
ncbi:hypothetical protein VDP97_19065, partial [Xanthomonas campestris pv. campestris]|nr:hypothetical protein [Xanthomonas campestris pv. campestris]MEA9478354.1 hypothetical protein [Xanthomonas campestris]MEA9664899.1 hypothetical protein [Xanthomonas campestris pv. raphani]MDM7607161.1 hypothetical protein [Xanthomonas campestris pv. campestris]MDM7611356.1 hypothetical protein [Xanthomonas campestris pv. campestris]